MNAFQRAMETIFRNPEFVQTCRIQGYEIPCIRTKITGQQSVVYMGTGAVGEQSFILTVKVKDVPVQLKPSDKVFYNYKQYKIASIQQDASSATYNLTIVMLSKGVN